MALPAPARVPIARLLARRLGYLQIDTGAMYRAAALLMSRKGLTLMIFHVWSVSVLPFGQLFDRYRKPAGDCQWPGCHDQIRTPEMSLMTSRIATLKPVRDALVLAQREMGAWRCRSGRSRHRNGCFPRCRPEVFLFASPEERGRGVLPN